jgi:hypothetical protein
VAAETTPGESASGDAVVVGEAVEASVRQLRRDAVMGSTSVSDGEVARAASSSREHLLEPLSVDPGPATATVGRGNRSGAVVDHTDRWCPVLTNVAGRSLTLAARGFWSRLRDGRRSLESRRRVGGGTYRARRLATDGVSVGRPGGESSCVGRGEVMRT